MVKAQTNVRNARAYFREHLTVGDYYCERQAVPGEWLGQGAGLLGLSGKVGEKAFLSLCNGRHPETGERLMQRLNSTRRERNRIAANRRVFFDFTISPPKSVLSWYLRYARIVELHNAAGRVCASRHRPLSSHDRRQPIRGRSEGAALSRPDGTK